MSNYPIDVNNFHETLLRLKGMVSVESHVENLEPIDREMLSLPDYAHLPHATLRRTNGGLENEVFLQFEFEIERSEEGLVALEFISWFIRDQARGGNTIQLRPFAFPPETSYGRQLGTTLKFHIDLFIDEVVDTLEPAFARIRAMDASLNLAIRLYQIPVKPSDI
ncbi:hypothetical protein [Paenibacillus oleatilyticus]|uniref:Uncharacterized protein n=1 Tax=Paenibacillus oleatilyticus TaxID=2594886 RepID=A0ABV4UZY7_9BACL